VCNAARGRDGTFGAKKQIFVPRSQVFGVRPHYLTATRFCLLKAGNTANTMLDTIRYLRDMAQVCTRLARACPDLATAHGLEEIAVDLMAKAKDLEHEFGR
jgi:hypothetical protein